MLPTVKYTQKLAPTNKARTFTNYEIPDRVAREKYVKTGTL